MSAIFALLACIFLGAPIEWYGVGAICAVWDLFRAAEMRKQLRLLEAHIDDLEAPVGMERPHEQASHYVTPEAA